MKSKNWNLIGTIEKEEGVDLYSNQKKNLNRRISMSEVNDILFKYECDRAEDQKATFG